MERPRRFPTARVTLRGPVPAGNAGNVRPEMARLRRPGALGIRPVRAVRRLLSATCRRVLLRAALLLTALLVGATPGPGATGPVGTVEELRLEKFVMPQFPAFTRLTGQQRGVVTVAIGRDAEGRVTDLLVLDSTDARLTESVRDAVSEWRFARPANQPSALGPVVPLVRFLFKADGIAMTTPPTGNAAGRSIETAPVVLPTLADLDGDMKPLQQIFPAWRSRPRDVSADATVTMKYFIDEEGRVRVPVVLESSAPELGEAALHAIAQWRYPPPRVNGRPTIAIDLQTFQFVAAENAGGRKAK